MPLKINFFTLLPILHQSPPYNELKLSTCKCCLLYKVSRKDSFWTAVMISIWEQLLRNNPTWQATGTADNLQDGPKALWPNQQRFIIILKSWTPSLRPTLGGIDTIDKYGILRSIFKSTQEQFQMHMLMYYGLNAVSSQKSYVNPNVIVIEGGAFGE